MTGSSHVDPDVATSIEHFDVLVVGAGLSGIGAACHLRARCPDKRFVILEAREAVGGTWDLFRYPGIRSDSDMFTLGYRFRPWTDGRAIADGPAILRYIRETAEEHGVDRSVRLGHRVTRAAWSSADARWTVHVEAGATRTARTFTCAFLYMCTGYYDYEGGYAPVWPGLSEYRGAVVHPQRWPEGLDYRGKRVVVIGSGATAITLVPAMAEQAAHVTMLQRSPTYVVTRPSRDRIADALRRALPSRVAYAAVRGKNVLAQQFWYRVARQRPAMVKRFIMRDAERRIGPGHDVQTHFNPAYDPWDQRLCLVPDADLFDAIRGGRASVATDHIERFTTTGIMLRSGTMLETDVVVSATGLVLKLLGGTVLEVDGTPVELAHTLAYKGMMFSDVPNMVSAFGYTNASWTLKCDLTADYSCRLLQHMDRHGYVQCTPRRNDPTIGEEPVLDFTSGYVQRALPSLPRQGSRHPWRLHQNYLRDLLMLRFGRVEDDAMEFTRPGARS